jgi:hypothetical protein
MKELIKNLIDFVKLPAHLLGALVVASGILLFLPENMIQKFYMTSFRDEYGFIIGIIFVVSISILSALLVRKIYTVINDKRTNKKVIEGQRKYLLKASNEKVSLICEFLRQPTHTLTLPMNDGLVIELQNFYVISPAGQTHLVSMLNPEITYFLQPWVLERIDADEELRRKFNRC